MAELTSQSLPVQSLYSWYSEGKLYVNRRYQRKLVWTLEEKQKLIESILKKYPVPAMLIAEMEGRPGSYEIIDGLQRLHTIISFLETGFPTLDGKHFNLTHFPTAKNRADEQLFTANTGTDYLSQKEVGTLLDYTLALSVMRNASEDEVHDVFGRINVYGHRLSDQERRQAGVQNDFSSMVREIACTLRGDVSTLVLPLSSMPEISIDLPTIKHGYTVKAEDVFWVNQGILRSTDLRDSMDEQCIADIAACIVGGQIIERSKEALDQVYDPDSASSTRVVTALGVYGVDKFAEEFKYCVDEIIRVSRSTPTQVSHLRGIVFKQQTTNAFPSVFAVLLIAFHELIIGEGKRISSYAGVRDAIFNLSERVETGRKATSPDERRKNIDTVKGLIGSNFLQSQDTSPIYGSHATTDIEGLIRRSELETSNYELKQGMLSLSEKREVDQDAVEKVLKAICGIANNGPKNAGKLIIGVTDKDADAARIKLLDGVEGRRLSKRIVVGVSREAKVLGLTSEAYFQRWRDAIKNSQLSTAVRDAVLSNIDFNDYYGLGVIVVTIPAQKDLSYYGDDIYWRSGDSTQQATLPKTIADLAKRFS